MSSTTPDMSPGALVDSDGNYCLQQDDMYNLLKYLWSGALLPLTPADYQTRLDISDSAMTQYATVIDNLVDEYKTVSAHCNTFKNTTYPAIVNIAADVYSYAQNAGGTVDDSLYASIFQLIRSFANTSNTTDDKNKITQQVDDLINVQVQAIAGILTKAETAVTDLQNFETQCMQDQSDLQARQKAVEDAITAETGSLADLKARLQSDRQTLAADQAAYEHDKIVACTTLTYAWVPFWGIIAASVVAGIFGHAAAELADDIDTLKSDISTESAEVTDDTRVIADLTAVDTDLTSFLAAIQPAITTIQKMHGIWSSISGDLTSLQNMIHSSVSTAEAAIAGIIDQKVVDKWNDLANSVQKYQQAAFLTQAQQTTIDQLSDQLHQQAQQTAAI
ncbi:uncharacterized protein SCHCODRAFT_02634267 [Schizophyllum commune H4-8]|uniref:uncharacterized protein n=1 Tax=Schizophyllum commune (strain H4-8 / FGSC 9210) TaxID=578458 RepID=UPI00215F6659|nr:uncharacterized protein SCHCODRAFT_02634267 [Schizophyllum commune H4-8]KAI5889354.1 hypothetical protein SCHCODRAFT_02634267 [Schizophyllum commune H4-8]